MVNIQWYEFPFSITIKKDDESILILKIGDFITYQGRDLGAKIISFSGNDPAGPIGMEYLPWRGDRWATPLMTLHGNPRFIICYPVGMPYYGQHINLNTIELLNNGECPTSTSYALSFSNLKIHDSIN